jgi:hypothetical protein
MSCPARFTGLYDSSSEHGNGRTATSRTEDALWCIYKSCEKIRLSQEDAGGKAKKLKAQEGASGSPERPESDARLARVIQALVDARSELDVTVDVVNVLADQQQFLSLTHIPRSARQSQLSARRDCLIAQAMKRNQIRAIAQRIRSGCDKLSQTFCSDTRFLMDVVELKKRWPVQEYERVATFPGTFQHEDCVTIDISFFMEEELYWMRNRRFRLGKHRFVVTSDGSTGEASALLPDPVKPGREKIAVGWEAIDNILRLLQNIRAWKYLSISLHAEAEQMLSVDSYRGAIHPGVCNAVVALADKQDALVSRGDGIHHHEPSATCMMYVDVFSGTELCSTCFRKKAALLLARSLTWARVPRMVRLTSKTDYSTNLEQLCLWMKVAAMWYDIASLVPSHKESLLGYIQALSERLDFVPAMIDVIASGDVIGSFSVESYWTVVWMTSRCPLPFVPCRQELDQYSGPTLGHVQLREMFQLISNDKNICINIRF